MKPWPLPADQAMQHRTTDSWVFWYLLCFLHQVDGWSMGRRYTLWWPSYSEEGIQGHVEDRGLLCFPKSDQGGREQWTEVFPDRISESAIIVTTTMLWISYQCLTKIVGVFPHEVIVDEEATCLRIDNRTCFRLFYRWIVGRLRGNASGTKVVVGISSDSSTSVCSTLPNCLLARWRPYSIDHYIVNWNVLMQNFLLIWKELEGYEVKQLG